MPTSVPSIARVPAEKPSAYPRWTNLVARLELLWQVNRERSKLQALDDRMLKDIGLDRGQVEAEASRSFFDIPGTRL